MAFPFIVLGLLIEQIAGMEQPANELPIFDVSVYCYVYVLLAFCWPIKSYKVPLGRRSSLGSGADSARGSMHIVSSKENLIAPDNDTLVDDIQ